MRLLHDLAGLRFEKTVDKARKLPFRIYDRIEDKVVAKFDDEMKANEYFVMLIRNFEKEICDAISLETGVSIVPDA